MAQGEINAFSVTYTGKGRVKELETTVDVSLPFDPNRSKPEDHPELITFDAIWDTGATNILLTATHESRPGHETAREIIATPVTGVTDSALAARLCGNISWWRPVQPNGMAWV